MTSATNEPPVSYSSISRDIRKARARSLKTTALTQQMLRRQGKKRDTTRQPAPTPAPSSRALLEDARTQWEKLQQQKAKLLREETKLLRRMDSLRVEADEEEEREQAELEAAENDREIARNASAAAEEDEEDEEEDGQPAVPSKPVIRSAPITERQLRQYARARRPSTPRPARSEAAPVRHWLW